MRSQRDLIHDDINTRVTLHKMLLMGDKGKHGKDIKLCFLK